MQETFDKVKDKLGENVSDLAKKKIFEAQSKCFTETSVSDFHELKKTEVSDSLVYSLNSENKIVLKYFKLGIPSIDKVLDLDKGHFFQTILILCYAKIHPSKETFSEFNPSIKIWFKDTLGVEIDFLSGSWLSSDKLIFYPKFSVCNSSSLDIPEIDLPHAILATCQDYCMGILGGKGIHIDQIKKPSLLKQACAKLITTMVTFIYYSPKYTSNIEMRKNFLDILLSITKHLNDAIEFSRIQNQNSQSFTQYLNKCQNFIHIAQKKILKNQEPRLRLMPWLVLYYNNADKLIRNLPLYILRLIHFNLKVPDAVNFELSVIFRSYIDVLKNHTLKKNKFTLSKSRMIHIETIIRKVKQSLLKYDEKISKKNIKQFVKKGYLSITQAGYYLDYILNESRDIYKISEQKSSWILNGDQFLRELIYNPSDLLKHIGEDRIDILTLYTQDEYGLALLRLNVLMPFNLLEKELDLEIGSSEFLLLMQEVIHPAIVDFSDIMLDSEEMNPLLCMWKPGIFKKIGMEEKNSTVQKARNDYFKLICTLLMVGTELSVYGWFAKILIRMGEFTGSPYAATVYQKIIKQLADRTLTDSLRKIFDAIKMESSFELSSFNILGNIPRTKEIKNWTDVRAKMSEQPFYKELISSHDHLHICCNQIDQYINKNLILQELKEWKKTDEKLKNFSLLIQDQLPEMDTYLGGVNKYNEKLRSFIITIQDQIEHHSEPIFEPTPIPVESTQPSKPAEIMKNDIKIQGEYGNSIFHALLGKWDNKLRMYACHKTQIYDKKKYLYQCVKTAKNSTLRKLIFEAIWEQMISGKMVGKYGIEYAYEYQKFITLSDKTYPKNWQKFQKILKFYSTEILTYVIKKNKDKKDCLNLKEEKSYGTDHLYENFQSALLTEKFDIYGRIQLVPELHQAFFDYHHSHQAQFILKYPFSDDLICEYADFIITQGALLSFSSLKVISYIFEMSLLYKDNCEVKKEINLDLPFETTKFIQFNKTDYFTKFSLKENFQTKTNKKHKESYVIEKSSALKTLGLFAMKKEMIEEKKYSKKEHIIMTVNDKEIFMQLLKYIKSEAYLWELTHIKTYKKYSKNFQTPIYKNKIAKIILQQIESYLHTFNRTDDLSHETDVRPQLTVLNMLLEWVIEILEHNEQWVSYLEMFQKKVNESFKFQTLIKSLSTLMEALSQNETGEFYHKQMQNIRKIRQFYIAQVSIPKESCRGLEIREMDDEIFEFDEIDTITHIYSEVEADKQGILRSLCLQGRVLSMYPFQGEREYYARYMIDHFLKALGGLWRKNEISSHQIKTVGWRLEEILFSYLPDNSNCAVTHKLISALLAKGFGIISYFDSHENHFVFVSLSPDQCGHFRITLNFATHILKWINQLYQIDCAIKKLPQKNSKKEYKFENNRYYQMVKEGFENIDKIEIPPQKLADFDTALFSLDENIPIYETVTDAEKMVFRPQRIG